MENVTLVKKVVMGINVNTVALQTAKTTSVSGLQGSVMAVKLGFMEINATKNAVNASMGNATKQVVSARKGVKLASMVLVVIKLALINVKTVVTRRMQTVTLVKTGFMERNVPISAQKTAKVDSVSRIQGIVIKDVKR